MRVLLALLAACGASPPPPPVANTAPPAPAAPLGPHELRGTITFPGTGLVAGTAVFVIAKPLSGGVPLAVDKLVYQGGDLAFHLDDSMTIIAGTDFSGDVELTARYDQDGDAVTKQPGDRVGKVRATIPADGLRLVVDQILK